MPAGCLFNGIERGVNNTVSGSGSFNFLIMEHQLHMRDGADLVACADHVMNIMIGWRNLHRFSSYDRIQFLQGNMFLFFCCLAEAFPYLLLIVSVQIITEFFGSPYHGFHTVVDAQKIICVRFLITEAGTDLGFPSGGLADCLHLSGDLPDFFDTDVCADTHGAALGVQDANNIRQRYRGSAAGSGFDLPYSAADGGHSVGVRHVQFTGAIKPEGCFAQIRNLFFQ